jgi:DNA-nicking Smr family endonuclease
MAERHKHFAALEELHKRLEQQARQRDTAEAERRVAAARRLRAADEFVEAMQGVTPLAGPGRAQHARTPHPPQPESRLRDERDVLAASVSDAFDHDALLASDESLSFCAPGIGPDVLRRLRRGDWSIQAQVDLHGHRVDEAREALVEFLRDAVRRGLRCVRVVHGKGLGSVGRTPVLKGKVRHWLAQRDEVIAFCQARNAEGGAGAVMVLLKPSSPKQAGDAR